MIRRQFEPANTMSTADSLAPFNQLELKDSDDKTHAKVRDDEDKYFATIAKALDETEAEYVRFRSKTVEDQIESLFGRIEELKGESKYPHLVSESRERVVRDLMSVFSDEYRRMTDEGKSKADAQIKSKAELEKVRKSYSDPTTETGESMSISQSSSNA